MEERICVDLSERQRKSGSVYEIDFSGTIALSGVKHSEMYGVLLTLYLKRWNWFAAIHVALA